MGYILATVLLTEYVIHSIIEVSALISFRYRIMPIAGIVSLAKRP